MVIDGYEMALLDMHAGAFSGARKCHQTLLTD